MLSSVQPPFNTSRTALATMMKLGYGRVSTDNEGQTTSIEAQEKRLKDYGCDEIFLDRASGGSLDRPGMYQLRSRVREVSAAGNSIEVIVTSPERFSREQIELVSLIGEFEKAGAVVRALDAGVISIQDPDKKLIWSILGSTYEFQRNNTKRKILRRKERDREERKRLGGKRAHFGYRWNKDNTQREPDPKEWPIAREIITRYLGGAGTHTLVRWLRDTHGIEYTTTAIYGWLKSDVWRGHTPHRIVDGKKQRKIFYNTHEPLISLSEERALEIRFKANKQYSGGRKPKAVSGLCRCISCNYLLGLCEDGRPRKDGRRYFYFRCKGIRTKSLPCPHSGGIPYTTVEPVVLDAICKRAADIAAAVVEPEKPREDPAVLQLRDNLQQLQHVYSVNQLPSIAAAIEDIQHKITYLRANKTQHIADQKQLDELVKAIARPDFWDGLGEEERNAIYKELGITVWCKGREITSVELG